MFSLSDTTAKLLESLYGSWYFIAGLDPGQLVSLGRVSCLESSRRRCARGKGRPSSCSRLPSELKSMERWCWDWVRLHQNSTKLTSVCSCPAGHLPCSADTSQELLQRFLKHLTAVGLQVRGRRWIGLTLEFGLLINSGVRATQPLS